MAETSIWGATSRAPAAGTMRLPVDTSSSSSPGYLAVSDVAGPIVYTANGVDDTSALTALFATSGSYLLKGAIITGAIALTSKNLTIDFDEGASLSPNAELDILWSFTTCNVIYKRFNVDGLGLCQIASYHNGGTLKFGNVTMTNVGWPVHTATGIVSGFFLSSVTDVNGDYFKATLFNAVGDGLFGNIGAVRGIDLLSCGAYDIKFYEYDATNCNGEQIDMFQVNTGNTGGVIHHFKGRYNGNVRRCGKYQSGYNEIVFIDIQKASDFVAVSGSTNIGAKTLNCIDWAASNAGTLSIGGGYIDASGYAAGICQTVVGSGVVTAGPGLSMLGPILQGIRNNPQTGSPETLSPVGFTTTDSSTANGSGISGVMMTNFYWPVQMRSNYSYCRDCLFIDPVHIFEIGDPDNTTQSKGIIFENNRIITQTSGYLNASRVVAVNNVVNARIKSNELVEDGNTGHASTFIQFLNASATATISNNKAPIGTLAVQNGSATTFNDHNTHNHTLYGNGADGDVTVSSGTTTLARDMYYRNLTISGTGSINTAGYHIYVSGILDLSAAPANAITYSGAAGSIGQTGGSGGASGATQFTRVVGGGTAGATGGAGGAAAGSAGTAGTAANPANGGTGGASGAGGAGLGGAGGALAAAGAVNATTGTTFFQRPETHLLRAAAVILGGSSGGSGGGGGGDGTAGAGGGGSGTSGGVIAVYSNNVNRGSNATAGIISSKGGVGGTGGAATGGQRGGGGGAGGGAGGWIFFVYGSITGSTITNAFDVSGGNGGDGGAGLGAAGTGGDGGAGGQGGVVQTINMTTGVMTQSTATTTPATGGLHSGLTGGTHSNGATVQMDM